MPTDKEFEDFFREQLGGLEETPPVNGWNRISQDLKPWYVRYRKLTALALLFLLSVATFTAMQLSGKFKGNEVGEGNTSTIDAPQLAMEKQERKTALSTGNSDEVSTSTADMAETSETSSAQPQNTSAETPACIAADRGIQESAVQGGATSPAGGNNSVLIAAATSTKARGREVLPVFVATKKKHTRSNHSHETAQAESGVESGFAVFTTRGSSKVKGFKYSSAKHAVASNDAIRAKKPIQPLSEPQIAAAVAAPLTSAADTVSKGLDMLALRTCLLSGMNYNLILPDSLPLALATSPAQSGDASDSSKTKATVFKAAWSVSAFVSPRVTFGHYAPNKTDELYLKGRLSSADMSDELSYEGGLVLHRTVSKKLTIDGGLNLNNLRDKVRYAVSTGEVESVEVTYKRVQGADVDVKYRVNEDEMNIRYTYAGLCLGATYTLKQKGESRVYASGGGMVHMLVNSETNIYRNGQLMTHSQTNGARNDMNRMNGQLYASLGFSRNVNPRLALSAEPAVGYFLGSVFRNTEVLQLKPYTFGVNIGLRYNL